MKISTKGQYAVEAVVDLAIHSSTSHESLKKVASRREISENYLEQIFMLLKKNGIVESIRGAQGGYTLAKDADKITVGDVIRAAEKQFVPVACIAQGEEKYDCSRLAACSTRNVWVKLMDEINSVIDNITIYDLMKQYESYEHPAKQLEYFV